MAQARVALKTRTARRRLPIASVRCFDDNNQPVSHRGELVKLNDGGFVALKIAGGQDYYG